MTAPEAPKDAAVVSKEEATPAPAAPATAAPAPTAPVTDPAAVEKPKRKSTPPAKIIQAPDPTMGELVTKATTAAVTAAMKASQTPTAPKVEIPEPELPEDIAEDLSAYRAMADIHPKYKGLAEKVVEFSRKGGVEDQYMSVWKKANPGKEYDSEDEEHEDFYSTKAPDFSETDLKKATKAVLKQEMQEEVERKFAPRLDEQRLQQISREVEPVLAQASYTITSSALSGIGEDLLKIASEKGDAGLEEADPLALQVVTEIVPQYESLAHEVVRVFRGVTKVDDSPSHVHRQINDIALKLDQAISGIDPENRWKPVVKNGRVVAHQQFASFKEYSGMTPEQQSQHWIIGQDEVLAHVSALTRQAVKARYDKVMASATKTIGAKSGRKQQETAPQGEPAAPAPASPKLSSPSIGSSTPTPTPKGGEATDTGRPGSAFARKWGGMR